MFYDILSNFWHKFSGFSCTKKTIFSTLNPDWSLELMVSKDNGVILMTDLG
jgi:hypothetical protein